MTTAVCSVSGGLSSFYMLRYAAETYDHLQGVFADVSNLADPYSGEDEDTMRVVWMCAEFLAARGEPLTVLWDGRSTWDVNHEQHLISNTQKDPCSRILKREAIGRWVATNFDPADTVLAVGFDVDESHRIGPVAEGYKPFAVVAPLADADVWGVTLPDRFKAEFGWLPWAYRVKASHSNCGGACTKAGIGQWVTVLRERPERYAYNEREENRFRAERGDYSILRDRRGGTTKPLTLTALRERVESQLTLDGLLANDEGSACSCFTPPIETSVNRCACGFPDRHTNLPCNR